MATSKKAPPLGKLIDSLWQLREDKRAAEVVVKDVEGKIAAAELAVMEAMDKEGVVKSTGAMASVGIGSSTQFNIVDFDTLTAFIKKNNYFHLFQRRITVDAAREIFEKKGAVPGLEAYTKRKLNLLTVK